MAAISIRDLDDETQARLKRGAAARGWTYARYITQLVQLHDAARARADDGDGGLQAELMALGLETRRQ